MSENSGSDHGLSGRRAPEGPPDASPPPAPQASEPPAAAPPAPPLDRGAASAAAPPAGSAGPAAHRPSALEALAAQAAPVALVAGLFGVLGGPLLMAQGMGRYLVLALDIVALSAGALGLWGALRRAARLDYAVAGLIMGAAGLYFWLSYMSDPPQGST